MDGSLQFLIVGMKNNIYYHCLFISLEYQSVLNFTASGSKGSMSGKVAPSGIS
jgi:hypothetical protein